ncbi:hypothetical protein C2S52_013398 [Perilla frutescens var. hirtella]|nr:hypothetical protein C2S51_015702 [Perilla frutescens var. frutescens]KAH6775837.1 hypothetical protein C2S52_013398 [Perilla frutescens var. hirtella]
MDPCWRKMIFIAVILAITIPISSGHRSRSRRLDNSNKDDIEKYLRDLCSETDKPDMCWNILKSELHKFDNDSDDIDIIDGVIELAIEKSKEIRDKLDQWFSDSNDENLKKKYHSCSKNYNEVDRNLEEAHRNLDSDDYRRIFDQIDDAEDELDKCKQEFGSDSFDPGHVRDRNNELVLYLDIVRAAADCLEDYDPDKDHN